MIVITGASSGIGYELAKIGNRLDVGNIHSYDNYGLANYYLEKRMWKEVVEILEEGPMPEFSWWNHHIGMAYHGIGDIAKAKERFAKLHSLTGPNSMDQIFQAGVPWNFNIFSEEMRDIYVELGLK